MKKVCCIILCIVLVIGFGVVGQATDLEIQPRWTALSKVSATLTASGETLKIVSRANVKRPGYTIHLTAELQEYDGGWETIKTWTAEGGLNQAIERKYAVVSGKYRVKATAKSYQGDKCLDTGSTYSSIATV